MMHLKLKAITYMGNFVDTNLLGEGIYTTTKPVIYNSDETIESLVESAKKLCDVTYFVTENYVENLSKCELTKLTLIDKKTIDILENALNLYWNDANNNLQRKDLGDIERKNYHYALEKSKEIMTGLDLV